MIAFYINLDRDQSRRTLTERQLRSNGLTFQRVEAVDKEIVTSLAYPKVDRHKWRCPRWDISDLSAAVFMSHRKAWQAVIKSEVKAALIMEDDVALDEAFQSSIRSLFDCCEKYDILRINSFIQKRVFGQAIPLGEKQYADSIIQEMADAGAYIVTRSACLELVSQTVSFCDHLDDFVFSPFRGLRTYQLQKPICTQFIHSNQLVEAVMANGVEISHRTADYESPISRGPSAYRIYKELRRAKNRFKLRAISRVQQTKTVDGNLMMEQMNLATFLTSQNKKTPRPYE